MSRTCFDPIVMPAGVKRTVAFTFAGLWRSERALFAMGARPCRTSRPPAAGVFGDEHLMRGIVGSPSDQCAYVRFTAVE
jgi:hypothetical protein